MVGMFQATATFDYIHPLHPEEVLGAAGWTDLLRITQGEHLLYEDRQGIANDLLPATQVVRERHLQARRPYTMAAGKPSGVLQLVATLDVGALGVVWRVSAVDRQLEPLPGEDLEAYPNRVRSALEEGYLDVALAEMDAEVHRFLVAARENGWRIREESLCGPWMELREPAAIAWSCELHALYGQRPSLVMDQTFLEVFEQVGAPRGGRIQVRINGRTVDLPAAIERRHREAEE